MKRLLTVILLFITTPALFAFAPEGYKTNLPEGTFKRKRNGEIVQYDKKGKKIGKYKTIQGRFIKVQ